MATGGLLAIYAHPDDETFGVGGTMAKYAERGVPVTMVCATRGEVGEIAPGTKATPETLGQFREQELRDAMAILGVHDVRFLDYRDSGMRGTPENKDPRNLHNANPEDVVAQLVRIIRERRPDVIATWDQSGGYYHPDHVAVHFHATAAHADAADASKHAGAGKPWSGAKLFYTAFPMEKFTQLMEQMHLLGIEAPGFSEDAEQAEEPARVSPNCILDVSGFYDRKIQAMLAHATQITAEDPFMRLPENLKREFFGQEYFYRAHPPMTDGAVITDFMEDE